MISDYILLILLLISSIIGLIIEMRREKGGKIPGWIFYIIFIVIILSAIIQVYNITLKENEEKYSANSGTLSVSASNNEKITYLLGTVTITGFQNVNIFGGKTSGAFGGCDINVLSSQIENGTLKINALLYDKDGNIAVKIVSNEWTVNPKFMWDKNFDNNGFEIVDDKDNIILQIVLVSGNVIRINGDFYCGGMEYFINNKGVIINPGDEKSTVEPIFKYPAINHPGERIASQK